MAFVCNLAAQSPDQVMVVINRNSRASKQIGEYYQKKRGIPTRNVCLIRTTTEQEIDRDTYEDEIAKPLLKFLKGRNLMDQVLYIVTTLGVPLKVAGTTDKQDAEAASVDSELTLLYKRLLGEKPATQGAIPNPFFGQRAAPFRHPDYPIYLVTRLAGYTWDDVRGMIDRALAAKNEGEFVLDLFAYEQPADQWMQLAASLLPQGRVFFDKSPPVVQGRKNVIGYASWGSNDPGRRANHIRWLNFEWLPGAIVTEYVSTNGRTFDEPPKDWTPGNWNEQDHYFAGAPQDLSADYIREGATGASGHVYEPFLGYTPRPQMVLPAYAAGRTLAESFYAGIPGLSWMNIVLGDPLCRLAPVATK